MNRRRVVFLSAAVELGAGVALVAAPALAARLLLGVTRNGEAVAIARVAGIAILSLGVACLPARGQPGDGPAALRALLIYNVLVAVYLGYLGALRDVRGLMLWPAVALHAVLAALLAGGMRAASARPP